MRDVQVATLAEIANLQSGGTPSKARDDYWEGDIPWISGKTLHGTHVAESDLHVSEAGVKAGSNLAPPGASLVLVRGMSLLQEIRVGLVTRPVAFNQDVKAITAKPAVDPYYLNFALRAARPRLLQQVHQAGHGTGVLATDRLNELPIFLPPLPEQQRIAGVLGAFDDLIETNRRLASDCERLLFASVGALAVHAPNVPLGSVAARRNVRVLPSEMEDEWYLGLEHFGTGGVGLTTRGTTEGITSQSQRFDPGDVLYGKLRPYFQKVARPGFGGVCSGEIWVLRAVEGYPQAALHAVVHNKRFSEIATAGSGGTKMPRADWRHMAEFPVPDVRGVLTRSGAQALEDLWSAACELRAEGDNLTGQRDELLPLLMSGKVRVSEAEGSLP